MTAFGRCNGQRQPCFRAGIARLHGAGWLRPTTIVTIMMVMSETLPLADVKARFSEVIDRIATTHDRVIVTRNGRPAAVLVSPDELEVLEETLAILSDPDARARLEEARGAVADGDTVDEAQLRTLLDDLRRRAS
jgi:prevent-host-death family protein